MERTADAAAGAAGSADTRTGRLETTDENEIRTWAEEYARKHGWVLNPDEKVLDTVIRGLARNRKKSGEQYCPCRLRSGDEEKDKPIICPCIWHKDEIEKDGHCHCRLYYRQDAAEKVREEKP